MPDVHEIRLDAELNKWFDVWSSYLDADTGEDPQARARLRSTLEAACSAAAEGDRESARAMLADMYDDAREAGLPWAPTEPRPCDADSQARDYAKDELRQVLPLPLRDELGVVALHLRVIDRRCRTAPGIDAATRQDMLYLIARAGMALDLAHLAAARHELDRLKALARRRGVQP